MNFHLLMKLVQVFIKENLKLKQEKIILTLHEPNLMDSVTHQNIFISHLGAVHACESKLFTVSCYSLFFSWWKFENKCELLLRGNSVYM